MENIVATNYLNLCDSEGANVLYNGQLCISILVCNNNKTVIKDQIRTQTRFT